MRVNSDVADELHVHSTPEHTFKIEPKPAQQFQFTVDVPGKVEIELHQLQQDDRHGRKCSRDGPNPSRCWRTASAGRPDLPIPYTYALIGAAWALTFTFAVVALAWRKPRFDPDKPGRALPQWVTTVVDASLTRWALAAAGLLFAAWVAMAAFFGRPDDNPLPGVFYVLLWVGLVAVSLAVGPVWRAISPIRTVYRLLRRARLPSGGGYPAAVGLLARGVRSVRVRLAGARQPGPGIARRDQALAVGLHRRSR